MDMAVPSAATPSSSAQPGGLPSAWPASIQPHGWLLVLAPDTLTILQASTNIDDLSGIPAAALCGRSLADALGQRAARLVRRAVAAARADTVGPVECGIATPAGRRGAWLYGHWGAGGLILEIEPSSRPASVTRALAGVGAAIRRYRAATDIQGLAAAVAADMLRLSGFDRAVVLRLGPPRGQTAPIVVAAAGTGPLPAPGAPFMGAVIGAEARAALELNRVRLIADAPAAPVGIEPPLNPLTGLSPDTGRTGLRAPLEKVTRALETEGARALMTISLMTAGRLWGVIWCDGTRPLRPAPALRAICEAVGEIAAAQIAALEEREQAARRMGATRTLAQLAAALRDGDDIAGILADHAADLGELFSPDGWQVTVDGVLRSGGIPLSAAAVMAVLEEVPPDPRLQAQPQAQPPAPPPALPPAVIPAVVQADGIVHVTAPGVGAVLRIDVPLGGHLLIARGAARPWSPADLETAVDLHRILADRHAELYRARTERQLHRLAFYDPVTDLPNRAYLMQDLQREMAGGGDASLLVLTLDRFKALKGSLGDDLSDNLLALVARRLEGCLGEGDLLVRVDSGAFAVLLRRERPADSAAVLSFAVKEALKAPIAVAGREIFVTLSQGLVPSARLHGLAADVLRNAEIAAYEAEATGGGARSFDSTMRAKLTERYALYDRLRHAIYFGNAIRTAYQPIVDLDTGELCGFEVLARWDDPERGPIPPSDFIPVAEETGLIVPLGNQVLVQACRNVTAWNRGRLAADPDARPLTLSVNLSPFQLDPAKLDLVRWVKGVLQLTGADPTWLVLEITESGLIANAAAAVDVLRSLRDLGVGLAIDDFGTGYSSLSYLQRLPVGAIKIDRSFVAAMDGGRQGVEMVRTIVQLARIMNFSVTAEGVESDHHLALLRSLGCRRGQGYFFARPLAADMATRLAAGERPWHL
ncbi:MAG: hypothetical protein RLY86_3640 [Pseudomonadota bacterium]|jgi:diguanylate cyclase (GGDEF)-like protein